MPHEEPLSPIVLLFRYLLAPVAHAAGRILMRIRYPNRNKRDFMARKLYDNSYALAAIDTFVNILLSTVAVVIILFLLLLAGLALGIWLGIA